MREKQTETDDKVELKPLLGMRPGIYLTILYSIILLIGLFFLLIFPGLKNPGAILQLKTEPDGAAIRVDGIYMGTSMNVYAQEIFVPKGSHTLQAVLPGFESESSDVQIPGRVFGSLFFPLRYPVEFTLKPNNSQSAFALAAADFASWSFGGEPTSAWQIPLSLSEGAYRAGPYADDKDAQILTAAARFAVTRAALRDLIRAKMLLDNNGLSPSPASLAVSVSDILAFLSENPESAEWLASLLPPESAAVIKASAWYKNMLSAEKKNIQNTNRPASARSVYFGLNFIGNTKSNISETVVPQYLYQSFLNENPKWKDEQDKLFSQETSGAGEITGVSWNAAQAFCQWLTGRLPPQMAAYEARLPTEAELEYAEAAGILIKSKAGWEWCADPFAPLKFIKAPREAVIAAGSPERTLYNLQAAGTQENRTSLPPGFSSPFVTFRLVIAEKNSGF